MNQNDQYIIRRWLNIIHLSAFLFSISLPLYALSPGHLVAFDQFSYHGHVYVNASHSGAAGEKYLLNQQLSNVKLYSDYQLFNDVKLHTLLIYNSVPNPILPRLYFEQAYLDIHHPLPANMNMELGKKWVAFGNYKNDLIYKPLTKALGQTNAYTMVMGYDNYSYANVSLYQPHSNIRSSSLPIYYNVNTGLHNDIYDAGVSYIYSLADSQLFQYNKGFGGYLGKSINSHVPGKAVYINFKRNHFNTNITYVSAIKEFQMNELSYQNKRAKPAAFSIQSGYEFNVKDIRYKVIGFYDKSYQALALKLPEQRAGVGLNFYPSRWLDVQLQYSKDYSYPANSISSGLNKSVKGSSGITNTLALQLIFNF